MGKLRLQIRRGVNREVRRGIERAVAHLSSVFDLRHTIAVVVVPASVLGGPNGEHAIGAWDERRKRIWLAGKPPSPKDFDMPEGPLSNKEWVWTLREILCHELAHYEQWRDGREYSEEEADARAAAVDVALETEPPKTED